MKKILLFMILVGLCSMVSATPVVDTACINDTDGFLDYDTSYFFNATVSNVTNHSWSNVTACTVNGQAMTGPGGNGTGQWNYTGTANDFSMAENCTYTTVTVNCTYNTSQHLTTTNSSWVLIPCVESHTIALTSATATVDTMSIVVADSTAATIVAWAIPQTYNDTHGQCNYKSSNNRKTSVGSFFVNLTSATPYCAITITRNGSDTGTIVAQLDTTTSATQPSSIPAAVIGTLTILVVFSHFVSSRVTT